MAFIPTDDDIARIWEPDVAKPEGLGLTAFQGTKTHFILLQYGLLGNLSGIKGLILTQIDARRTSAVWGALEDDQIQDRKKRDYWNRVIDDFIAFLALQRAFAHKLSLYAAVLDNKIRTLTDTIDLLENNGQGSAPMTADLRELRHEAQQQVVRIENTATDIGQAKTFKALKEIGKDVTLIDTAYNWLLDKIRAKRQATEAFSNEAHIRPNIVYAQAEIAFYESVFAQVNPETRPAFGSALADTDEDTSSDEGEAPSESAE
jgi:hypothetical protein